MLTNPRADRVRSVRALSKRPVRDRTGRFAVEGPQGVREALRRSRGLDEVDVRITQGRQDDLVRGQNESPRRRSG